MIDLLLKVPAAHIHEFQQILTAAEITFKREARTDAEAPVAIVIKGSTEQITYAKKMLVQLDIYSAVIHVLDRNLKETFDRVFLHDLKVKNLSPAFRVLGKVYLHRVEIEGSEGALYRYFADNRASTKLGEPALDIAVEAHADNAADEAPVGATH